MFLGVPMLLGMTIHFQCLLALLPFTPKECLQHFGCALG